jgi:hypothetical protein
MVRTGAMVAYAYHPAIEAVPGAIGAHPCATKKVKNTTSSTLYFKKSCPTFFVKYLTLLDIVENFCRKKVL